MLGRCTPLRFALPALVAIPLLVACSSSTKNNNGNSSNSNNAPAASVAATIAATPSAPTTTATAIRTATPRAGAATAARTATPSGSSSSAPSAGSSLATAAAGVSGTPTDQALQAQLQSAILQEKDLPTGFSQQATDNTVDTTAGMTAGYNATYTMIGQGSAGLDIEAIVVALAGFKDSNTAQANFKDIQNQIQQGAGADIQLTPVTSTTTVGDQSVAFKVAGSTTGVSIAGYAVIWRHGKLAAAVVQVGAPGPQTIDSTVKLAQTQDTKLGAVQ